MKIRERLLLFLHGKKICSQCHHVLYLYHFENQSSICRRCARRNIYRIRKEEQKYLYQCPYCKSIKLEEWYDGFKTMYTCKRCKETFFKVDIKKVLKKRYRKR